MRTLPPVALASERTRRSGASPCRPGAVTTVSSVSTSELRRDPGVVANDLRQLVELCVADPAVPEDLLAEAHVRALLAQRGHRAGVDLCGEEPHGVRSDVDHPDPHLGHCDLGIGRSRCVYEHRLPLSAARDRRSARARAEHAAAGSTGGCARAPPCRCERRDHVPSGVSSQEEELSAKALSKTAVSSWRSRGASTGTSTSMRRSRLRVIRSALPRKTSTESPASNANEPAVLQVAAGDRADGDAVAEARYARTEHADRPRRDLDLRALLRGRVELVDDRLVRERVHLQADAAALAGCGGLAHCADAVDQACAQRRTARRGSS